MIVSSSAKLRFVSIPPRKMRLVANMVKGLHVHKALNMLGFTPKIAAQHVARTVKSAAANALSLEGTDTLRPEDLIIKHITVDAAPTAKRIRFQSMGRVFRYRKRFSHLTVFIEGQAEELNKAGDTKKKKAGSRSGKTQKPVEGKSGKTESAKNSVKPKPNSSKEKSQTQEETE
ncbi:MAG: 50S ribosomal protein L22 [candidate division Zixibacteria bacterium]|nr:50S ribosomal protein L22 [candidate division Zixibacteria bacterium]